MLNDRCHSYCSDTLKFSRLRLAFRQRLNRARAALADRDVAQEDSDTWGIVDEIITACVIAALIFVFSGCVLGPIGASQLSSSQMRALKEYNDTGDVYACGTIGGPPPIGSIIFIVVPKGTPVDLAFPPSCPITVSPK